MLIREKGGNSKAKILTRNNDCDYIKGTIHQEKYSNSTLYILN